MLFGYRIERGDWFVSTTGGKKPVTLEAKETTTLEVDPAIRIHVKAKWRHGKVNLFAGIGGMAHMGLSIYHQGKRIPLEWVLEDKDGKELARGAMRYG